MNTSLSVEERIIAFSKELDLEIYQIVEETDKPADLPVPIPDESDQDILDQTANLPKKRRSQKENKHERTT